MNQEKRTGYLSNIIFLSALCLFAAALVFLMFVFNRNQAAKLQDYENRITMEDGEEKLYTTSEVEAVKAAAREEAVAEKEDAMRKQLKETLLSGKETSLSALQTLFPDEVIVQDEFGFCFAPVLDELAKNEYVTEGLWESSETGVRVSSENGTIRWSVVTDYAFAFIRAGYFNEEGGFMRDVSFYQNVSAALSYGVRVYPYIEFAEVTTRAMGEAAAEEVLSMAGDYAGEIEEAVMVLLAEEVTLSRRQPVTDGVLAAADAFTENGFRTILGGKCERIFSTTDGEAFLASGVRLDEAYVCSYDMDATKAYPYSFSFWEAGLLVDAEGISGACGIIVKVE